MSDQSESPAAAGREQPESPASVENEGTAAAATKQPDSPAADGGPLHSLLLRLAEEVGPTDVDELWIFPPRRVAGTESAVVVLSAFETGDERRRILTGLYTLQHDKRGRATVQHDVQEHGAAPQDRLERLIEGVLRRLDDELAAAVPRAVSVRGEPDRWDALLAELRAAARAP